MTERKKEKERKKKRILQLLDDGLNQKEISERLNCSKSLVSIYLKEMGVETNIKRNKELFTREYLIKEYLNENKSVHEIGRINNVSPSTVLNYLDKFKLKKNPEDIQKERIKNRKKTLIKKYGVEHPIHSKEIKGKILNTNIKKFGFPNPFQNEAVRGKFRKTMLSKYNVEYAMMNKNLVKKALDTKIKNGNFLITEFGTISEIAEGNNIPEAFVRKWITDNGHDAESIEDMLFTYGKGTSLELFFEKRADLKIFNKKNKVGYRPDFKIDEQTYVNVDGLYWHSELHLDKKYHWDMRKKYEDYGLRIFQFREDEVYNKISIINSMIDNYNKKNKRIGARKTSVIRINQKDADLFYNRTHIMGTIKAKHLALIDSNGDIAQALSYKNFKDKIKIERMSSALNVTVQGGFGKLFKFLKNQNKDIQIDYWVDLRYGTGNFLKQFGFKKEKETLGWKWTDFKTTYNRLRCRANMDERGLTQAEHAAELGWVKIYDAGQRLWVLKK